MTESAQPKIAWKLEATLYDNGELHINQPDTHTEFSSCLQGFIFLKGLIDEYIADLESNNLNEITGDK